MSSALASEFSGRGSNPGRGHRVVLLGKIDLIPTVSVSTQGGVETLLIASWDRNRK